MKLTFASILLFLVTHSSLVEAATDNTEILVITSESDGIDETNKVQRVYPAEVVSVLKYDGKRVLARRAEYQPSTIEFPDRRIRNSIWLLLSSTAKPSEFVKVAHSPMDGAYSINRGPDAGTSYFFARNGEFTASEHESNALEADPPAKWKGHLYRKQNIIWARPDGKFEPTALPDQLFILTSSGQLCDARGECFR